MKEKFDDCGGFFGALCDVLSELETVATVERASTSSGLRHGETGEAYSSSGGQHLYIPVVDGSDIPRFLSDLHDRCWLNGFGWGGVSAAGSFLKRSIVDKSCGSPERLAFEGAAVVVPPLVQDGRIAVAHDGTVLDTKACCPQLTDAERATLATLVAAERQRLKPDMAAARATWCQAHVERLVAGGVSAPEAQAKVRAGPMANSPASSSCLLIIAGNHKPKLHSIDEAMRRRLALVPFTVTIPKAERDRDLSEKLVKAEGPAILRWMVDGCLEWQKTGLGIPKAVREASDNYFAEHDHITKWLEDCTEHSERASIWTPMIGRSGASNRASPQFISRLLCIRLAIFSRG